MDIDIQKSLNLRKLTALAIFATTALLFFRERQLFSSSVNDGSSPPLCRRALQTCVGCRRALGSWVHKVGVGNALL